MQAATLDRQGIVFGMLPIASEFARVSTQELQAMLLDTHGATIITLTAITVPDYRKTGCPFKNDIQKFARVNGMLNWDYQRAVNAQRVREDKPADFVAEPRRWGTPLNATPFVSHVNNAGEHKLYLRFKVQSILNIAYFTLDGKRIAENIVEPFLTPKEQSLRQGLERGVVERDYTVANLCTVFYNGMGYYIA